jgi:hypothetical protein
MAEGATSTKTFTLSVHDAPSPDHVFLVVVSTAAEGKRRTPMEWVEDVPDELVLLCGDTDSMVSADFEQVDAIVLDEACAGTETTYTAAVEFPCSTAIGYRLGRFTATETQRERRDRAQPMGCRCQWYPVRRPRCGSLPATITDVPWGGADHRCAG